MAATVGTTYISNRSSVRRDRDQTVAQKGLPPDRP